MIRRETHLYRGTTIDWPGNSGLQKLRCTPTSSDPLVATLFAIECSRHGRAVVYVARMHDVASCLASPNCFAESERELVIRVAPLDFIREFAFTRVPAERCREIFLEMQLDVPAAISNRFVLDQQMKSLPRLTDDQIARFDARLFV